MFDITPEITKRDLPTPTKAYNMQWLRLAVASLAFLVFAGSAVVHVEAAWTDNVNGKRRPSFQVMNLRHGSEVRFRPSPLIGGPPWLPLHVKLILRQDGRDFLYDFVPLDATDTEVLARLTSLQNVPGEIRSTVLTTKSSKQSTKTDDLVLSAQEYCETYPRELNLLTNNCWTFAIGLAVHLSEA